MFSHFNRPTEVFICSYMLTLPSSCVTIANYLASLLSGLEGCFKVQGILNCVYVCVCAR